jgi:hypothetical protein
MLPAGVTVYARLCGWTVAQAHARSGDRIALAAYLGGSEKSDQAIADFAATYADQNERDYAALQNAVKEGKARLTPRDAAQGYCGRLGPQVNGLRLRRPCCRDPMVDDRHSGEVEHSSMAVPGPGAPE